ncbi:MAG: hypothetical protein LBC86_05225 [Oscillospiraceae bacterium]|jgi:hypothetical protein|nr:hypothetical protein [Oscillospiraceae bacterium]
MSSEFNVGFIADGELFGFSSNTVIAYGSGGLLVAGELIPGGKSIAELTGSAINNLPGIISGGSAITPKTEGNFSAYFLLKNKELSFLVKSSGVVLAVSGGKAWSITAAVDTQKLKNGNSFEKVVYEAANRVGIKELVLLAKQENAGTPDFKLLGGLSGITPPALPLRDTFKKYQLIAGGIFDLEDSTVGFGKALRTLTGLKKLDFFVGGNFNDASFMSCFIADTIETEIFEFKDFSLKIAVGKGFSLTAGGQLTLKLSKEISFNLSGDITETSFMLSAYSLENSKIYLNNKLFFSDLCLAIGYNNGLALGMTGRLTSRNLSIFAGFCLVCSPYPRVNLLTAAITTSEGCLSLRDLIAEIAEVNANGLDALDVIAIKDLNLNNVKLRKAVTADTPESEAEDMFDAVISSEMKINAGDTQLTPMDDQFILTDKGRMRHYRIDKNGVLSLNCQIFICTEALKLGQYDIKPGFFICGTLELFGIDVRFLFQVEKGVSLIALVQLSPINIGSVISITASGKKPPIPAIDGGLAGQLVKPDSKGAVFYLNVSKNSGLTCYIDAKIDILKVFLLDAMVVIRDRRVFINIEAAYIGFKLYVKIDASYQDFKNYNFNLIIGFDTSGFSEIVREASKRMRDAAKSIGDSIEKANRELTNAQQRVWNLNNEIASLDRRINDCQAKINNAKWYKKAFVAIAEGAKILAFQVTKSGVYIAIGVAYAAIEVAKAALAAGGAAAQTVLKSVAWILNVATNLLWVKSFELSIHANSKEKKFATKLTLVIMGMEKTISGSISTPSEKQLNSDINKSVKTSLDGETAKAIEDTKKGKIVRYSVEDDFEIPLECHDINALMKKQQRGRELLSKTEDLFLDVETAYIDVFGDINDTSRMAACEITEAVLECDSNYEQMVDIFDGEFTEALNIVDESIGVTRSAETAHYMSCLHDIAEKCSAGNTHRSGTVRKDSLFSRLENNTQEAVTRAQSRSIEEVNMPYTEKNKAMSDCILKALNKHLGDADDSGFINLKKEEAILDSVSLLRFSGKRRKQAKKPNSSDNYTSFVQTDDEE